MQPRRSSVRRSLFPLVVGAVAGCAIGGVIGYLRYADERHEAGVEAARQERWTDDEVPRLTDADVRDMLQAMSFNRTH